MAPTGILFIDTSIYTGPVFSVYRSIVDSLDRERFRPHVAIDLAMKGPWATLPGMNIKQWAFGRAGRRQMLTDRKRGLVALKRWIRENDIAVLHCSQETACSMFGVLLGVGGGPRVLIHQHTAPDRGGPLLMRRVAMECADANVGVSEFICDSVRHYSLRRRPVDCVHNGIDTRVFSPEVDGSGTRKQHGIGDDEILLMNMGRLEPYKRQEDFARAFVIAKRQVPKLRGLVIGWENPDFNGAQRGMIHRICREAGLGDALKTEDARQDPWSVHAAADVFVMPAVDEPFGLVVAEAMASAKPVIGVRSGALPEIVVSGETGLIVEPRSPEQLAAAMVTLAKDAELRKRMGAAGRERAVRMFSKARMAREFGAIYDRLARPA